MLLCSVNHDECSRVCEYRSDLYTMFFFFKQKTAYDVRISDWSSDVCSSDLSANVAETASATKTHRGLIAAFGQHLVLGGHVASEPGSSQIGRASCRESVCQYV